jgi:hypothetical protein
MNVDRFFTLRARLVDLARGVEADPASIGVLSTGEACAVALLLDRLDFLDGDSHPLDVLDRLGLEWENAVRDLHRSGGGRDDGDRTPPSGRQVRGTKNACPGTEPGQALR